MAYYALPQEEKQWTKFGIEGQDNFSLYVSKRHFRAASRFDTTHTNPTAYSEYIPQISDVIMANYNKYIYEIVEVKDEIGMFLQSKQHVWEFIVRTFKDEHISTTNTPLSADYIADYTDKDSDVFDQTSAVNVEKVPILYTSASNEKPSNDPFGGW